MKVSEADSPIPFGDDARRLTADIELARDLTELVNVIPRIRELALALVSMDAGAMLVARVLSSLNDRLSRCVIRLVVRRHRLPPAAWCWLAMGSEGRDEQLFATDQDNGLVFSAADHAEAAQLRRLFVAFAKDVNDALAGCGFPHCPGGIMAGNEKWCLSVDEWQRHFASWIHTPEPQALLNATIFFDLRGLYGDAALVGALRGQLAAMAPSATGFLHMMASQALSVSPPLGRLREFAFEGEHPGLIDLKKHGSRLFVDAARVLALAAGVSAANTAERLRAVSGPLKLHAGDMEAAIGAFSCLQRIRLQAQDRELQRGAVPDNFVAPDALNAFDRRLLAESLKQARRLQSVLKQRFGINT